MDDVKVTVMVTAAQAAYLERLRRERRIGRGVAVRTALERLMAPESPGAADPFFLPPDLTNGTEHASIGDAKEAS